MKLFHAGMSVCSQKVRLALAEKSLDFDSVTLDLQKGDQFSAEYIQLNPARVVPTLLDKELVVTESTLINEYLDDAYPHITLRPDNPADTYRMRRLVKLIDDQVHQSCGVITYAIALRTPLLEKPEEELEAMLKQIPDPLRRYNRRQVLDKGVNAEPFQPALARYMAVLADANQGLANSRWCAGAKFSLADCALLPYVLRLEHLQLLPLLADMPELLRWYDDARARSSWGPAMSSQISEHATGFFSRCGEAVQAQVLATFQGS